MSTSTANVTRIPTRLLHGPGSAGCPVERVKAQFSELERHVPTFREVAARLGMSQRTLRRRLQAQDTSYNEILRDIRRERAAAWLHGSSLTVDRIAEQLGYTEVTNFRHAFRRWTGCSPRAFRRAGAQAPMFAWRVA